MRQLSKRLINWLIPEGQRAWRDVYRLLSQSAETNPRVEALRHDVARLASELSQTMARLALELSQTKAGVSAIQAQSGEASSHIVVLRRELSEMTARLNEVASSLEQAERRDNRRNAAHDDLSTLPGRLDLAASNQLKKASELRADAGEEQRGLAAYYARMADLVSGYWIRRRASPQDLFPTDDFSIEFARQIGIDIPEAYAGKAHPSSVPWRHLWFDPDCGILLVLGQSTAVNHSKPSHAADGDIFVFDFLRMLCLRAADFPSAPGNRAFWTKLGSLLIGNGIFHRVLIVWLDIEDWMPGGSMQKIAALAFSRLRKELGVVCLPFSAVLWQRGAAEARRADMSALDYKIQFRGAVADLRGNGVFAPVFLAVSTLETSNQDACHNSEAVRRAQSSLPDATCGIFAGPDLDSIRDRREVRDDEWQDSAELWLSVLTARRGLLQKIPSRL